MRTRHRDRRALDENSRVRDLTSWVHQLEGLGLLDLWVIHFTANATLAADRPRLRIWGHPRLPCPALRVPAFGSLAAEPQPALPGGWGQRLAVKWITHLDFTHRR